MVLVWWRGALRSGTYSSSDGRAHRDHGLRPSRVDSRPHLEDRDHTVSVIDSDPEAFRRLGPSFKGTASPGSASTGPALTQAGIEHADAFAAVSSGDNSNIISARVARETFGVQQVVARIYDPRTRRGLRAARHTHRGDGAVDGRPDAAQDSVPASRPPSRWRDPSGAVVCTHRGVHPHEAGIGRPVTEFEAATGGRVGFVTRFGNGSLPTGHRHPVRRHAARAGHRRACRHPRRVAGGLAGGGRARMRVAIAGPGAVGRSIARELLGNGARRAAHRQGPAQGRQGDRVRGREWLLGDACEVAQPGERERCKSCEVVDRAPPATTR